MENEILTAGEQLAQNDITPENDYTGEENMPDAYSVGEGDTDGDDYEDSLDDVESTEEEISLDDELVALSEEHPEVVEAVSAPNKERYAQLRALGLSPKEAYLASSLPRRARDGRSHLTDSMPRSVRSPEGAMTRREMRAARELFSDLCDAEIQRLYKKVTK